MLTSRLLIPWTCLAGILFAALGVGCSNVKFVNPLSHESNSEIDERLIGFWTDASDGRAAETPQVWQFAVGRAAQSKNTLEVADLVIENGQLKVERATFWTARINNQCFISVADPDKPADGFLVVRYEFVDKNMVCVYLLDIVKVAELVDAGVLAGSVKKSKRQPTFLGLFPIGQPVNEPSEVRITAEAPALREFFEKHGANVWDRQELMSLRRIAKQ